ncbi:MAG TPA: site-specific DNA-methyltransferase [Methanolinea sp.]|nr:site-specific DNA-methyltransferase [Methanolinea sp.]
MAKCDCLDEMLEKWQENQSAGVSCEPGSSSHHPPRYTGEFWTSAQRQASSIHEVSYRACFKPQLPRFFITLLTERGDLVYDPFCGRGTTILEAGLCGRNVAANDINPLSRILTLARLHPPRESEVAERLSAIPFSSGCRANIDLSMFYHPDTESSLVSLRQYLLGRQEDGREDHIDRWIRMVATSRLTGHSNGFFSVYTLPPNQAVSPESQARINRLRDQVPPRRDVAALIIRKTRSLLRTLSDDERTRLFQAGNSAIFSTCDSRKTHHLMPGSVQLTVTSPPFLDIVQYSRDNWLRCWFNGIDDKAVGKEITMARIVSEWSSVMQETFFELARITRPGGFVAFEVGEVRKREVNLEDAVVPLGESCGLSCQGIIINSQQFTKTSHIWGVDNNRCGTNSNRIVVFQKEE